ncbi:hypothetical protein L1887_28382 [Cichorium endivia]|nr:hypothetical protein L1887_28382 [Cichorium endivia]
MAFLRQFLPSIFLSIFIINGCFSSNSTLLSFSCGNGLEFRYPFWQLSHNRDNHGYPSLGISCIDKTPNIQLGSHLYHVKRVNNSEKTLLVSFYESTDTICPVASHAVRMNSSASFLTYSNDVNMIHFFYNCTVYPSGVEPIKCLQIGAKHAYVFLDGSVPEFDWKGYCESLVTIPVMNKSIDGSLATSFGKALNEGFELKWSPNHDCRLCEVSGGFCTFDDNNIQKFSCSCSEGRRYASCHDQGLVTSEFKIGLLSIGLIVCCLTIAGLVFYIVKKRRNGIYKKGFNPLPSSGR